MEDSCYWILKPRPQRYSSYHFKIALFVVVTACVLLYACSTLRRISSQLPAGLYPMVQFDRGDFTRDEILDTSQNALQALSKLNLEEAGENGSDVKIPFLKNVPHVGDRKTRRQLLALEALGLSGESDFRALSSLGNSNNINNINDNNNNHSRDNDTFSPHPPEYFASISEIVTPRTPDYGKLCFNLTFTLANPQHVVDKSFCARLEKLGRAIEEGREIPLLTIFTWWLDPINDCEILSRKSMMANWDTFRPFIIPVVFTNSRMNMAFANGHGWPCYPVNETNGDGLPVFKPLTSTVYSKFTSSFYGYAKPIAMFDSSLLETLLSMKNRFKLFSAEDPSNSDPSNHNDNDDNIMTSSITKTGKQEPGASLLIYGNSIKIPHTTPDHFINFERLHKYLRVNPVSSNANKLSVEKPNYIFFTKGIDFTDIPPLVVHDNFLFQFVVDFCKECGHTVIEASKTLLAMQTFRVTHTNEWGRRYLYHQPPDPFYNRKLAMEWHNRNKQRREAPPSGQNARRKT